MVGGDDGKSSVARSVWLEHLVEVVLVLVPGPGLVGALRSALSALWPHTCPGPISSGRSSLELRGELWGCTHGSGYHWCPGADGPWVGTIQRSGFKLLLPEADSGTSIWEVTGTSAEE